MSRSAATAELGLTRTAVGEAVASLAEQGLVRVDTAVVDTPARGRPSPMLHLDPSGPVVIAAHLRPDRVDVATLGLGGVPRAAFSRPLPRERTDPERIFAAIAGFVREAIDAADGACEGVGLGVAGMVGQDGEVHSALHLGWSDVPAAALLENGLGLDLPVRIGNDSALAALAEYRRGAGRGARTLLVLGCDRVGIGGALLGDGLPLPGTGHALEAGHVIVDPRGARCACGQHGCLELYADGRALSRLGGGQDAEVVLAAARGGDRVAVHAVEETTEQLGIGLASLVNVLGPDRVVLTGLLAELYGLAADRIDARLADSLVARAGRTEVMAGEVRDPVIVGAGELAFELLLRNEISHA
ncbi:MAG: hypothetical protein QOF58_1094 [Pseudonocardiales bacterium]|jgi:predicted NBD/HSP70 family sugar kinase|nr:hypothetical protein [Pseudonocardiales bacterium]